MQYALCMHLVFKTNSGALGPYFKNMKWNGTKLVISEFGSQAKFLTFQCLKLTRKQPLEF
jgi:hypothetical protein